MIIIRIHMASHSCETCLDHEKQLNYICKDHDIMICSDCAVFQHRTCRICSKEDGQTVMNASILRSRKHELITLRDKIRLYSNSFDESKARLEEKIKHHFSLLRHVLEEEETKQINLANSSMDEYLFDLNENEILVERELKNIEHVLESDKHSNVDNTLTELIKDTKLLEKRSNDISTKNLELKDATALGSIIEIVQEIIKEPIFATSNVEFSETIDTQAESITREPFKSLSIEEGSRITEEDSSERPFLQSDTPAINKTGPVTAGNMPPSASTPPVHALNTDTQFEGNDYLLPATGGIPPSASTPAHAMNTETQFDGNCDLLPATGGMPPSAPPAPTESHFQGNCDILHLTGGAPSASAPHAPTEKQLEGNDDLLPPPSYQDVMQGAAYLIPPQPVFTPGEYKPCSPPSGKSSIKSSRVPSLTLESSCVIRTGSDSKRCRIVGALFRSNGDVVLADKNNKKIKFLNMISRNIVAEFETGTAPFGITEVLLGYIAVSCPNRKQILFLKIENLPITVDRSVQVDQPCLGIAYAKNKLFVVCGMAWNYSACIRVYGPDDRMLYKIKNDSDGKIIVSPQTEFLSIFPDSGNLVINTGGLSKEESMYVITQKGHVVWREKVVDWTDMTTGNAVLGDGVVVVRDNNAIFYISPKFPGVWRQLTTEPIVKRPYNVATDKHNKLLLVTQSRSYPDNVEDDKVKLFTIFYHDKKDVNGIL